MSELALLRPGPVLGSYPEKEDERLSTLDRAMAVASGWVRQRFTRWRARAPGFLRRVKKVEESLAALPEHELGERIVHLRHALREGGLTSELAASAFGLIRLTAERQLGLRPFDVQILGGLLMLQGRIAEMDTGEGKTLTATLPAATAALAGAPVHVITVNDYLAARDAEWMRPVYEALGLTVDVIVENMSPDERRRAYSADIVYGSNKQMAFDYLKDRIVLGDETRPLHMRVEDLTASDPRARKLLMRGLCFAIVDEADSCLIDEARTPLIISRAGDMSGMELVYVNAIEVARKLLMPRDFVILPGERRIRLTDLGRLRIRRLTETWGSVWAAEIHREELSRQALSALWVYERDKHYIVRDEQIAIVDEYTGRIMADRSWERGLHQMIEVKEGLDVTGRHETLARISYQRFFRRYLHVCGMTGTAREVAGELWSVYGLTVQRVPPNRRSRRRDLGHVIYVTEDAKLRAIVKRVAGLHQVGSPVLIGTRSVATSEALSALLTEAGFIHNVLNANRLPDEALVVAQAGQAGQVTVATNMAGRGTDITLGKGVEAKGGLFVIATEPHDARRIDRQLYGRCGRQGNRGAHIMMASLEDEIVRETLGDRLRSLGHVFAPSGGRVPSLIFGPALRYAQWVAERRNSATRRALLRHDDSMEDMLAFAGRAE